MRGVARCGEVTYSEENFKLSLTRKLTQFYLRLITEFIK